MGGRCFRETNVCCTPTYQLLPQPPPPKSIFALMENKLICPIFPQKMIFQACSTGK